MAVPYLVHRYARTCRDARLPTCAGRSLTVQSEGPVRRLLNATATQAAAVIIEITSKTTFDVSRDRTPNHSHITAVAATAAATRNRSAPVG